MRSWRILAPSATAWPACWTTVSAYFLTVLVRLFLLPTSTALLTADLSHDDMVSVQRLRWSQRCCEKKIEMKRAMEIRVCGFEIGMHGILYYLSVSVYLSLLFVLLQFSRGWRRRRWGVFQTLGIRRRFHLIF